MTSSALFGFAINIANDALTSGSIDSVTDASFPVPGAIPLEFDRQFNASISGRDTMGPFGLGWLVWQIAPPAADSAGNVTISRRRIATFLYTKELRRQLHRPRFGEYGTLHSQQWCVSVRRDRRHNHRVQFQRHARMRTRYQR